MKKASYVLVLLALVALVGSSFADVQNIRLSGDIRLRGYYLELDDLPDLPSQDSGWIKQRTRVSVEADLEDHILAVVTLRADGQWGEQWIEWGNGDSGWSVNVQEAYVQANEMFYSPVTAKLGRQFLHYGRGLIISSWEQEQVFDAARLVLDYYPLTLDIVAAKLVDNDAFGSNWDDSNLLFVNGRYEMSDALLKCVEGYLGYLDGVTGGASPLIVGLRGDLNISKNVQGWLEGAYEFGNNAGAEDISAFLVNAGMKWTLTEDGWRPALNVNYIFASGDDEGGKKNFVPWFDYVDGYNGYLAAPWLSNIHIINVGLSGKPANNVSLAVQGYYYIPVDDNGPVTLFARNDLRAGDGYGTTIVTEDIGWDDIGWEVDGILGYDYSKDVRCQLVYALFVPDKGQVQHELRGEVNVKF